MFTITFCKGISSFLHDITFCKRSNFISTQSAAKLQWRHNERDGVSNHQRLGCLLNRLFRCRSKKTSKFRVPGLCEGSPWTFPSQKASNAENTSIWWRHDVLEISSANESNTTGQTEINWKTCWPEKLGVQFPLHCQHCACKWPST